MKNKILISICMFCYLFIYFSSSRVYAAMKGEEIFNTYLSETFDNMVGWDELPSFQHVVSTKYSYALFKQVNPTSSSCVYYLVVSDKDHFDITYNYISYYSEYYFVFCQDDLARYQYRTDREDDGWVYIGTNSGNGSYNIQLTNSQDDYKTFYSCGFCSSPVNIRSVSSDSDESTVYAGDELKVYDSDLGYIKDFKRKSLHLDEEDPEEYARSIVTRVSFSDLSTTDVDLTSGDYYIRVYHQMRVFNRSGDDVTADKNMPLVLVGEYSASALTFDYNDYSARSLVEENSGDISWYNLYAVAFYGYDRYDTEYYQIVTYDNMGVAHYGGYLKITFNFDGSANISDGSEYGSETINPDGTFDDTENGYSGEDSSFIGIGTDYEGADFDSGQAEEEYNNSGNASINDLNYSFNNMTDYISNVPLVIGKVFSFLPEWCLNFVVLGFSSMIAIMVIKALRG